MMRRLTPTLLALLIFGHTSINAALSNLPSTQRPPSSVQSFSKKIKNFMTDSTTWAVASGVVVVAAIVYLAIKNNNGRSSAAYASRATFQSTSGGTCTSQANVEATFVVGDRAHRRSYSGSDRVTVHVTDDVPPCHTRRDSWGHLHRHRSSPALEVHVTTQPPLTGYRPLVPAYYERPVIVAPPAPVVVFERPRPTVIVMPQPQPTTFVSLPAPTIAPAPSSSTPSGTRAHIRELDKNIKSNYGAYGS